MTSPADKREQLARLLAAKAAAPRTFPLSYAQERLWFLDQLEPGSPAYNIASATRLALALDPALLARCFNEIIARHEALRTVFAVAAGKPVQRVLPRLAITVPFVDLTGAPDAEAQARELADREAAAPFDLATGPLLRVTLVRLGAEDHLLLVTLHHIVVDGWSFDALMRELDALYRAFTLGLPSPLPPLPLQYPDWATWQREWMSGDRLETQLAYWRAALAGAPPLIDLPTDRMRPARQSRRGASHHAPLGAELTRKLIALGQHAGATPFMTLLAGFAATLARWSGGRDLVVGTPIANRTRAELEPLIGLFINTLALRVRVEPGAGFRSVVHRVREATLGAFAHQDVPFEKLVEELHPVRDLGYTPVFQVMFVLQSQAPHKRGRGGAGAPFPPPAVHTSKFDLSINAYEHGDGIDVLWEYATDLFDAASIARLAARFEVLLAAACAEPDRPLDELPFATPDEAAALARWSTPAPRADAGTVVEALAAQAARTPAAPAVIAGGETVDHAALHARAGALATRLAGLAPETVVALCVERTADLAAGMLGILQAGAAYLPLDPAMPRDRLAALARTAGAQVIVTQRRLLERTGELARIAVVLDELDAAGPRAPAPPPAPGHLAYVVHSSRAAGRPVGVLVEHGALLRHLREIAARYALGPDDRVLQFAGAGYDASIEQMLAPLLAGAAAVLRGDGGWSPAELARAVFEDRLTVLILPEASWHQVVGEWARAPERLRGHRLRLVVVLGDGGAGDRLAGWRRLTADVLAGVRLLHVWGPTETVIGAACHEPTDADDGPRVPIGHALAGKSLQIVDGDGRPAPIGTPGELCVGGDLARGYLGEPALTAARFVPDPFGGPGGRRFRTGERARRGPDGAVEVLGKLDRRVTVGGFAIELDAIEAALRRHPDVGQALAAVREDGESRRVVAYVVPGSGTRPGAADLRRVAAEHVPSYMVPAAFVIVDRLPDAAHAPAPPPAPTAAAAGEVAPSPDEARLAAIWAEVLGVPRVGVHDNFFDLGGHSLTATQVVARIRDAFELELPLRALFESPTIAELAIHLGRGVATSGPPLRRLPREADPPLSFAQERLWFLDQFHPNTAGYNIPSSTVTHAGDRAVLERALAEVVRRHEALRTTFPIVDGRPVQRIHPSLTVPLELIDLSALPLDEALAEARRHSAAESRTPFDLAAGPLLRARLLRLATGHILLLTAHHIVADGWSFDVLLRELHQLYDAFVLGDPSPLPELPLQYADWSQWQRQWLTGERLDEQLAYWRRALRGAPPALDLPTDHPRPAVGAVRGATHGFWMPAALRRRVEALGLAENATTFMTLLAGFAATLHRWSGQADLVIGSPIANRTRAALEDMIGFFVNTLALRVTIGPGDSFRTLLQRVREVTLGGYAHQDLPFERLVEELRPERDLSRNPVFQVMFVMQNAPGDGVQDDGGDRAPQPAPPPGGTAKFDLSLFVTESGKRWLGGVEYNADVLDAATIERFERRLIRLLEAAVDAPDAPLASLPLLEPDEAERLRRWSAGPPPAAAPGVLDRFLAHAARRPDDAAVLAGERVLAYGALRDAALRVAGGLAGPLAAAAGERRVGLCVARGPDGIAALLGILAAGAAYVPLDPAYPAERLRLMIDDARPAVVIADAAGAAALAGAGARLAALDQLLAAAPAAAPLAGDLAYVMYTSGSTGRPKGVAMPHRALAQLVDWQIRRSDLPAGARTTQFAPWSFDVSFQELFATLGAGGTLVIVDDEARRDPALTWQLVAAARVARVFLPPVALRGLAEAAAAAAPPDLREIVAAGEQLVIGDALAALLARSPHVTLFNQYGPTETHVVTEHRVTAGAADARTPPIGRPLPGVAAHVLDATLAPAPEGVVGELYLGGGALARGYVDQPALTADRFVPDPTGRGARLYRTGDRARWRGDGTLAFLGRADDQVKVRGYRIEPGEVEAALERHPAIAAAAVSARGEGAQRALCAYVVPAAAAAGALDLGDVRRFLREHLPEHLVPSSFTIMSELPLTPSGKLDRRALPAPAPLRGADRGKVAPATPVEVGLAEIWGEVLGLERLGAHDNFFELGGHSLLGTQVVARARARFGVELPLRSLFEQPTIAGLAVEIVRAQLAHAGGDVAGRLAEIEHMSEDDVRPRGPRP